MPFFGISSFLTQISIVVIMVVMNNVLVIYGARSRYAGHPADCGWNRDEGIPDRGIHSGWGSQPVPSPLWVIIAARAAMTACAGFLPS